MADKAIAYINGGTLYPDIVGKTVLTAVTGGTLVEAEVYGLPDFSRANGRVIGPHGFHLHVGKSCDPGSNELPFPYVGGHYNPDGQPHGNHAGDFPTLFSNRGMSRINFFTNRFTVNDVLGLTVVVHESPDDGRSQPGGDAGRMIACGIIREYIGT